MMESTWHYHIFTLGQDPEVSCRRRKYCSLLGKGLIRHPKATISSLTARLSNQTTPLR